MEFLESIRNQYPFVPKQWQSNRGILSFIDQGKGVPVVCLHGNPTWSFFYRKVVISLCNEFRCVVPDHLGCGLSQKPAKGEYILSAHIDRLHGLLNYLKIKYCHLIVHDWGGAIGCGLALKNRDRIKSLTLLNTAAFLKPIPHWTIKVARIPFLGALLTRGLNAFAWGAAFKGSIKGLDEEALKGFLGPYNSWKNRLAIHRFVQDIPTNSKHPTYSVLKKIDQQLHLLSAIPMNILWGEQDFCFNDSFLEEWKNRFPNATVSTYKKAGHYLLEDASDKIIPNIRGFLKQITV